MLPRCKELAWRASHGVLPMRVVLGTWGIDVHTVCPVCGEAEETVAHALFFCGAVVPIWFGSSLSLNFRHAPPEFSVIQWLYRILKVDDDWVI